MNGDEIARLEVLMRLHGIAELDVTEGNLAVHLSMTRPSAARPEALTAKTGGPAPIRSASFGHLLLSHPHDPAEPVFPRAVRKGEIVAWLDACGRLQPVISPDDGTLVEPLAGEGDLIGYGAALFSMR